jgi:hypothetical protein
MRITKEVAKALRDLTRVDLMVKLLQRYGKGK